MFLYEALTGLRLCETEEDGREIRPLQILNSQNTHREEKQSLSLKRNVQFFKNKIGNFFLLLDLFLDL